MMLVELRKYVSARFGRETWDALGKKSGVGPKFYLSVDSYSDEEAMALLLAASRVTRMPLPAILEDFGEFIAPDLICIYPYLVKPEWRTLDLIEHTEGTIHHLHLVRAREAGADPPALKCTRLSADEVALIYSSARRMCSLAVGIAKGIARHYNERIEVTQTSCMLDGSPSCNISIKRRSPG